MISVPGDRGGANEGKSVIDLEVASDGTYYLGGATQAEITIGFGIFQSFATIAAIDSDGHPVLDFGNQGTSYPGVTVTQFSDGPYDSSSFAKLLLTTVSGTSYIVAAGTAKVAADDGSSATLSFAFAEYTLTGQLVPGFGGSDNGMTLVSPETAPDSELADAALLPDGSIVAVGDNNYRDGSTLPSYTGVASSTNIVFVELKSDGTADSTFGGDGEDVQAVPYNTSDGVDATLAYGLAIEGDTWIIVGGAYTDPSSGFSLGTSDYLVLQFEPDIEGATQLTATATPAGTINLNWASVGGIGNSFGIQRGPTESGPFTTIGSTLAGATSYTDSTVLPGMTYWYQVYAITSTGPAGYSNPASATTPPANEGYQYLETITVPIDGTPVYSNVNLSSGVPYLLVATGDISQTADGTHRGDAEYGYYPVSNVSNWWLNNPETTNTLGYEYGISVGASATALNGFYTKYPYWGPLATDSNHTDSVIYTPTATAALAANYHDIYYPDNTTGNAGDIPLQVAIYQPLPPTPSDLIAQGNTAERAIDLSWTLPTVSWLSGLYSGGETVAIERSNNGGSTFTTVATVPSSQTTWLDNNISPNSSYVYRVFSQVAGGQLQYSNAASATWIVNAPHIQPIVTQTAVRGAPFTLQVQATDPQYELDGLNYSLSNSSTGLTINSNGLIQGWTPTTGEAGDSYFLTVTVTDSAGISSNASFTINVPQGTSPIQITSPASIRKISGNQYALSVGATEPGVDPSDLFYTWSMQWNDPSDSSPPTPTFSPQGTNEAQNSVVTLFGGGDAYGFVLSVSDSLGNIPATSGVGLSVVPVLSSLQITLPQPSIETGSMPETLSAQGIDQFGNSITASSVSWFVTSGNASGSFNNATGQFTPTSTPGVVTVLATAPVGISTVSATTTISVSGLSAPDGLTVGVVDPNSVPLSWNASTGSSLAGYDVLESLSEQGPFVTALNGMLVSNTSTSISTIPGTTYYFEVVAQDTSGIDSPPSNILSVPVPQEDSSFPPAPTGLVAGVAAVNYGGITRVALDWNGITGQHILGYDVYRSSIPNFVPMTSNLIGSSIDNEYVDNSSLTSGNYYYVVKTANDLGDSAPSNQASVNLSGPVYAPTAPTNVTATALSGTSVQVAWTDTSYNETEFLIKRSGSLSGPWTQVGMVPTNVTSYTDTVSSLGTATYYEITAVNPAGSATSAPSDGIQGSTPVATGIVLVPTRGTVQTGGNDQITAEVVDQYGNPLASQPSSFTWSVESGGAGGTVNSSGLYVAPSTLSTVNGVLINDDIVEATADGLTGQVTVETIVPQAPVVQISSVDTSNGPALLTQDTEIDGIVVDPAGGSISYTLTATPEAGGGPITISTGTSPVGAVPNQSGSLGTVSVAAIPDGVYTLTLTATDQFGLTSNASVLIQVQSALKLGNLTLPFTDLTLNPSGSTPVPITRTYDSSTASTDTGLGYGWTLNVNSTDLRSTVPPQNGIDEAPGYEDGNLLYITTPDGVQHTFEFLADPTGDFEDNPLAGLVGDLETYTPQFLCVDGSGSKLILADSDGNDVSSSFTLYQLDGRYIDESGTGQDWFNPVNPTFGLHYILVAANGTQYSVDPTSGQLMSATDANGNTTTYSSGSLYNTSTGTNGDITSITDIATGQTVQYYYGDDPGNSTVPSNENDLIGFIDPAGNKTTYIYGDQLIVPYNQSASVYAVITCTAGANIGEVWNTVTNSWSAPGANDQISLPVIDDSAGAPAWYSADGPAITPGTTVSIAYYKTGTSAAIYTEARTWSAPHLLTGIIDPSGVTVLTASYDPTSNLLVSLVNSDQQSSSVSTGGFNGTTGDQTTTDAAGNTTEDIYDQYGNVIRQIQTIENAGIIQGYMVTVSSYSYFGSAQAQASYDEDFAQAGVDPLNDPTGDVTYAPFEVTGTDPDGLRYSEQPPTPPQQIATYYSWNGVDSSLTDPDLGQLESEMTLVGPGTTSGDYVYNVTNYSGYSLASLGNAPTTVQQLGEYSVSSGGATTLIATIGQSATVSNTYDPTGNGNLLTSQNATGVVTQYTYTNGSSGVPAGLLLDTYESSSTAPGGWALLSSNAYYGSTNASIGALAGLQASTTTYNYEYQGGTLTTLSQTSYYVYDAQGNILLSYTPKNIGTTASPEWVWSTTSASYNMNGQQLSTSSATYTDPASVGSSTDQMNITVTWNTAATSITTGGVVVNESLNAPAAPLPISQTSYTATGQTQTSTDQYGGATTTTYDAAGNLVSTVYPDGTGVRSVFNALGEVIWQTDRSTNATLNSGAHATETIYNSLNQVVGTERFSGVLITVATDPNADGASGLEESTLANPTDPGTPLSSTGTVYNGAGQPVETDSASGLRTGTIYNADGTAEYTGPLNPLASSTWYLSASPLGSFLINPSTGRGEYTTYLYNLTDASLGNPWSGMAYNATIDADGHSTNTFEDSLGRTIFTVYADDSFAESLYSVGDQPITSLSSSLVTDGYTLPSIIIPEGGSETVSIAQRKNIAGDPIEATIDVYDAAGNLVDVYEPPVVNAATTSTTPVMPHTHYDYDASGDEIDQIDANGEASANPLSGETFFTYDANGNELSRTLPDGEQETYTYNVYGQVATHTDFDGNRATYIYYSNYSTGAYAGSVEQIQYVDTSGSGKTTETVGYTFDSLGRELTVSDTAEETSTDPTGTTTNTYDSQGNLHEQETPEGTIWYVFDPTTGEHTETYTSYTQTDYGYNAEGQLLTVTVVELNGTMLTTPLVTSYTYDGVGNELTETLPDGELSNYAYDDLNRLVAMNQTQGATILFTEQFVLNDDGSRKSTAETQRQTDGSTSTLSYAWGYDGDARLNSESLSATGDAAADDYSDTYTYDLDRNRYSDVHVGPGNGASATTINTYDGDDELLTSNVSGGASTQYDYDANGSQLTSTNGSTVTTNTYDVRNRLSSVTTGGVTTTYGYDDDGNRVSETTAGTTTYYLIDSSNPTGYAKPIEQWTSTTGNRSTATLSMSYVIGDRVLAQVNGSGVVSYLLVDGQDNTRALTNSSGVVTATFNYNAFGSAIGSWSFATAPTTILFQQTMYDVPSGLNIFGDGVREVQPGEDSFIESDQPIYGISSDPITLNLRLLDGANPISNIDQNGHSYATQFGTAVHNEIAADFRDEVGDYGITFKSIFSIIHVPYSAAIGTLLPDLVYYNPSPGGKKEVFEIKPDNVRQIIAGYAQLATYVIALNKIDPTGGWTTGSYSTFTAPVEVTTDDPVGFAIVTQLPGGLIVYSSFQDYAEDRAERTAEAEGAEEEGDLYQAILDNILGGV